MSQRAFVRSVHIVVLASMLVCSPVLADKNGDAAKNIAKSAALLAAQLLLRDKLDTACTDAGINQCGDITQGVLLFLEGNPTGGRQSLRSAAQANTPDQVKNYAQIIIAIGGALNGIQDAQPYIRPVLDAANFLASVGGNPNIEPSSSAPLVSGGASLLRYRSVSEDPSGACRDLFAKRWIRAGVTMDQCISQLSR